MIDKHLLLNGVLLLWCPFQALGEVGTHPSKKMIHYPLRTHDLQRMTTRKRLLQEGLESDADAPLFQGIGTHYIDLYIGTPSFQTATLIVDTGSGWTAFPCVKGCCGDHTDPPFDFRQSATFTYRSCDDTCGQSCHRHNNHQQCHVQMTYSEGSSWKAFEAQDVVSLWRGGAGDDSHNNNDTSGSVEENSLSNPFPLRFGCQTSTTKLFRTQLADGIMGMDDSPLSFWRQAGAESFSLCFRGAAPKLEGSAGVMTLNGYDDRLHLDGTSMRWAKRRRVKGRFFGLYLQDMYFATKDGNETMAKNQIEGLNMGAINAGGVILDSGTTTSSFPVSQGRPLRDAYQRLTGHSWFKQLSLKDVNRLPTLVVELRAVDPTAEKVLMEFPPLHYMWSMDKGGGTSLYEPALEFMGGETVLGADIMRGHNIHFSKDRIGIAPSNCDYESLKEKQTQKQQQHAQPSSIKIEVHDNETPGDNVTARSSTAILSVGALLMVVLSGLIIAKASLLVAACSGVVTGPTNYEAVETELDLDQPQPQDGFDLEVELT